MRIEELLPAAGLVRVDSVRITPTGIDVELSGTRSSAMCTFCGNCSRRVHSQYWRMVHDLPRRGTPVRLHCVVRRFFCGNGACSRRIFVEPLPELVTRRARSTARRDAALVALGMEAGGDPGARLGRKLGLPTSGDTILRRLRRQPVTPAHSAPEPVEIGIDDFAFRRGQRYGTIILGHRTQHVIDLLPKRTSDVAAAWLKGHSGIGLVTRDRAGPYAMAVTAALPGAL